MKKKELIIGWFSLFLLILGSAGCKPTTNQQHMETQIDWGKLPDLPGSGQTKSLGVSAPFTGIYKENLMVAGGCNFPDKLPAEGGNKEYYTEVYLLDMTSPEAGWTLAGNLPDPVAYGGAVSTPEGIICIGGNNNDRSFREVFRLSYENKPESLKIDSLPSLPAPMDNMAAAYRDNKVYVAGGNENGDPDKNVYILDLEAIEAGWKQLTSVPGNSRVQPTLAIQQAEDGIRLFVSSGFQPVQEEIPAVVATGLLSYHLEKEEWRVEGEFPHSATDEPQTFTGGNCLAYGTDRLLFAGGVNYPVFSYALNFAIYLREADQANDTDAVDRIMEEMRSYMYHPVEWYRFNRSLLIYNTMTKEWTSAGEYEQLSRAGAGMVLYNDDLFIINGELKPGVRTPEVNKGKLNSLF